jgi:hypothetical protein
MTTNIRVSFSVLAVFYAVGIFRRKKGISFDSTSVRASISIKLRLLMLCESVCQREMWLLVTEILKVGHLAFPWVFSHGHTRCTKVDPLVKTLLKTGFQFRLILFCVQTVSEITFACLDKNIPAFKENKSQILIKARTSRAPASGTAI